MSLEARPTAESRNLWADWPIRVRRLSSRKLTRIDPCAARPPARPARGVLPTFELKSLVKLVLSSYRRPAQVVTGGIGRNPSQPGRKGARILEGIEVLVRAERHVLGEFLSGLRAAYAARVEGASVLFEQDAEGFVIAPSGASGEEFDLVILR